MSPEYWQDRSVFLTGHTGFKGAWLSLWLERLGARVTGYGLPPTTQPALSTLLTPWPSLVSIIGDIRDRAALADALAGSSAEIVVHLAAQSLVSASYLDPIETFDTNVMGTANLLQAIRGTESVRVVLVITSDKVYDQRHGTGDRVEGDRLGGSDPYSASKVAQELVSMAFARSYLSGDDVVVATARAGNVIGGGDWASDRLLPDYFRAVAANGQLALRNPEATRPWQHVLDCLGGYLTYIEHLSRRAPVPTSLNFGPAEPPITVAEIIARLGRLTDTNDEWSSNTDGVGFEDRDLRLDSSAARDHLQWSPRLPLDTALRWTADWYGAHRRRNDMRVFSLEQIDRYLELVL